MCKEKKLTRCTQAVTQLEKYNNFCPFAFCNTQQNNFRGLTFDTANIRYILESTFRKQAWKFFLWSSLTGESQPSCSQNKKIYTSLSIATAAQTFSSNAGHPHPKPNIENSHLSFASFKNFPQQKNLAD